MDHAFVKLVVGLGNPGTQYEKTRHNAGFFFLKAIQQRFCAESFTRHKQCVGKITTAKVNGVSLRIVQPSTYMNISGQSVLGASQFFKIDLARTLIIHDDLDLPAGTIRLKQDGGHGGHNGLRDIIQRTQRKDFLRLRIGVGHPGESNKVSGYVLKPPTKKEQISIDRAIELGVDTLPEIVRGDFSAAMQQLHSQKFE